MINKIVNRTVILKVLSLVEYQVRLIDNIYRSGLKGDGGTEVKTLFCVQPVS